MKDHIKQFLSGMSGMGCRRKPNPYKLLLQHGVYHDGSDLPANISWGQPKQCFMNAARLAINNAYVYCEGYAVSQSVFIPLHHAWVIDTDSNKVIDNTWRNGGAAYFGVPFTRTFLASALCINGVYGSLIFDHEYIDAEDREKFVFTFATQPTI